MGKMCDAEEVVMWNMSCGSMEQLNLCLVAYLMDASFISLSSSHESMPFVSIVVHNEHC